MSTATVGQAIDQILAALAPLEKRQQQTIISTVCEFLELSPPVSPAATGTQHSTEKSDASGASPPVAQNAPPKKATSRHVDIRSLKQEKQPESAAQMACVVAYYLSEHAQEDGGASTITTSDLEKYFKQAGFPLPKKLEQVLADGKRSGYFEQVARGEYKLTRVGYNLVAHSMPKSSRDA